MAQAGIQLDILIIGRSESLYETARQVSQSHRIVGILTAPASPEFKRTERDFENLALALGCLFLCTSRIDDAALAFVARAKAQLGLSSHWVSTLRQDIFDEIPLGILNAHHGDLPRYRGNAVLNWMMIHDEPCISAMVHFMEPGELDSGDIVARRPFLLDENTTIRDVLEFIEHNVPQMFLEVVNHMAAGTMCRTAQADAGKISFRCYPRLPVHSRIEWSKPAREIHRLVRASTQPYDGAYSYLKLGGLIHKLTIWESRLVSEHTEDFGVPGHVIRNDKVAGETWVYTGEGVIALKLVQVGDDSPIQPGLVWNSIRFGFGIDIEAELIAMQHALLESKR